MQQLRGQVPCCLITINEDRASSLIDYGIRRGDKRERRNDDVIIAANFQQTQRQMQRQMQRGRPAAGRHGVLSCRLHREFIFKRIDMRAQRSDPVRIERIDQQFFLLPRHMRGGKVKSIRKPRQLFHRFLHSVSVFKRSV